MGIAVADSGFENNIRGAGTRYLNIDSSVDLIFIAVTTSNGGTYSPSNKPYWTLGGVKMRYLDHGTLNSGSDGYCIWWLEAPPTGASVELVGASAVEWCYGWIGFSDVSMRWVANEMTLYTSKDTNRSSASLTVVQQASLCVGFAFAETGTTTFSPASGETEAEEYFTVFGGSGTSAQIQYKTDAGGNTAMGWNFSTTDYTTVIAFTLKSGTDSGFYINGGQIQDYSYVRVVGYYYSGAYVVSTDADIMFFTMITGNGNNPPSAVSYGGDALTRLTNQLIDSGNNLSLWVKVGPKTGSNTLIAAGLPGEEGFGVWTHSNVDTDDPYETVTTTTYNSLSLSITPSDAGHLVYAGFGETYYTDIAGPTCRSGKYIGKVYTDRGGTGQCTIMERISDDIDADPITAIANGWFLGGGWCYALNLIDNLAYQTIGGSISFSSTLLNKFRAVRNPSGSLILSGTSGMKLTITRFFDGILSMVGTLQSNSFWKQAFSGILEFAKSLELTKFFDLHFTGVLSFAGKFGREIVRRLKANIQLAVGIFYPRATIETAVDGDDHSVDVEVRH
jgi:hypothetical protein